MNTRTNAAAALAEEVRQDITAIQTMVTGLTMDMQALARWGHPVQFPAGAVEALRTLLMVAETTRARGNAPVRVPQSDPLAGIVRTPPPAVTRPDVSNQLDASSEAERLDGVALLIKVLEEAKRPMRVAELERAMTAQGWDTRSNSRKGIVANTAGKAAKNHPEKVQKVAHGLYAALPSLDILGNNVEEGPRQPVGPQSGDLGDEGAMT